jgi:hypothetical protein
MLYTRRGGLWPWSDLNRHCERTEAIQLSFGAVGEKDGLPRRFAPRNDGVERLSVVLMSRFRFLVNKNVDGLA